MLKCDQTELLEFVRQRNVQTTVSVVRRLEGLIVVARIVSDAGLNVIS